MDTIKRFKRFVNESVVNEAAGDENKTIVFLSGKASATRLGEEVAKQLGIKRDAIYTLELPSFGSLAYIANKETGAAGDFTKATEANPKIKLTDTGKKSVGKDVLIINGKEIKEGKGTIVFEKSEISGKALTITVSNNGFLAMVRLGSAMLQCSVSSKDSVKPSGLSWYNATNSSIEIGLGGNVKDESSREGTFTYAITTSYKSTYTALKHVIGLCVAKCAAPANQPDELTFPDYKEDSWTIRLLKETKGVTNKTELSKIAGIFLEDSVNMLRSFKAKSKNLINDQEIKTDDLWTKYVSNAAKYTTKRSISVGGGRSRDMILLTSEGDGATTDLHNEIAKRMAPSKLPDAFKASEGLLKTAQEIVTYALEFPTSGDYSKPVEDCQTDHEFGKAASAPGSVNTGEVKYQEGKF